MRTVRWAGRFPLSLYATPFRFSAPFRVTRAHSPSLGRALVQVCASGEARVFKRAEYGGRRSKLLDCGGPRFHALESSRGPAQVKSAHRKRIFVRAHDEPDERGGRQRWKPIGIRPINQPAKSNGQLMPNKRVGYHGESAFSRSRSGTRLSESLIR